MQISTICLYCVFFSIARAEIGLSSSQYSATNLRGSPSSDRELLLALSDVLGRPVRDLDVQISERLKSAFAALPHSRPGHIQDSAVKYLLSAYFMRQYGWLLTVGSGANTSVSNILGDVLPSVVATQGLSGPGLKNMTAIVTVLDSLRKHHGGLGLNEVTALAMLLEALVVDGAASTLSLAYAANGFSEERALDEVDLDKVIDTHLQIFAFGGRRSLWTAESNATQEHVRLWPDWVERIAFARDTHRNVAFTQRQQTSPFERQGLSFEDTSKAAADLTLEYGQFHHGYCEDLKSGLAKLDLTLSGRVPLGLFYAQNWISNWHLSESMEYLQSLGVVDETVPGRGPQVIISNYVQAVSNCDAPSKYYSICCVNECESLLGRLESGILAPAALPAQILDLVTDLSSSTIDAPRNISSQLVSALGQVAMLHSGKVPLHSRLFAQWMHYAFPLECPYPYLTGTLNPMTRSEWISKTGRDNAATASDKAKHIQYTRNLLANTTDVDIAGMSMWTLEDESWVGDLDEGIRYAGRLAGILQCLAGAVIVSGMASTAFSMGIGVLRKPTVSI